jgi:hypothetical protein
MDGAVGADLDLRGLLIHVDGHGVALDVGLDGQVREQLDRQHPGLECAVLLAQHDAALAGHGEGLERLRCVRGSPARPSRTAFIAPRVARDDWTSHRDCAFPPLIQERFKDGAPKVVVIEIAHTNGGVGFGALPPFSQKKAKRTGHGGLCRLKYCEKWRIWICAFPPLLRKDGAPMVLLIDASCLLLFLRSGAGLCDED